MKYICIHLDIIDACSVLFVAHKNMAIYGDGMGEAEMKDVNMVLYGVPNGIKCVG